MSRSPDARRRDTGQSVTARHSYRSVSRVVTHVESGVSRIVPLCHAVTLACHACIYCQCHFCKVLLRQRLKRVFRTSFFLMRVASKHTEHTEHLNETAFIHGFCGAVHEC